MKFLTNENVPIATVYALRESGHDVVSISERSPGIADTEVLKLAKDDERILITFDSDYGELVYFAGYAAPLGIIYLRIIPKTPVEPAELIKSLIAVDESILVGSFLVLDRDSIRRRMMPESA